MPIDDAADAGVAPVAAPAIVPPSTHDLDSDHTGLKTGLPDTKAAIEREAADALIQHQAERDRAALLKQDFMGRPPTWIQTAAAINLADYPALADPSEEADRNLRTLEWLISERAREAGGRAPRSTGGSGNALDPPWWRMFLPAQWVPILKEHRTEVVAISFAALLFVWLASIMLDGPWRAGKASRRHGDEARPAAKAGGTARRSRRRRHPVQGDAGTHGPEPLAASPPAVASH